MKHPEVFFDRYVLLSMRFRQIFYLGSLSQTTGFLRWLLGRAKWETWRNNVFRAPHTLRSSLAVPIGFTADSSLAALE